MRLVPTSHPHRLECREGSHTVGWIALAVIAGVAGVIGFLFFSPGFDWSRVIASFFLVVLFVLPAVRFMARWRPAGVLVAADTGTVMAWRGLLFRTKRYYRLDRYDAVRVGRYAGGPRNWDWYFPVSLEGAGRSVVLITGLDRRAAQRAADDIAQLVGFDLIDDIEGREYRAEQVGRSLQELVQQAAPVVVADAAPPPVTRPELPPPPAGHRVGYAWEDLTLVITLPRPRLSRLLMPHLLLMLWVGGVAALIVGGVVGLVYLQDPEAITWAKAGLPAAVVVGLAVAFIALFAVGSVLSKVWLRTVIESSPDGLRVSWRGLIGQGNDAVKASAVRDIDPVQGIVTRARNVSLRLEGLTAAEEGWILDAVGRALTAGRGGDTSGRPDSEQVIAFPCPHCGGGLEFGAGAAGTRVLCPACKRPAVVPAE